jgi:hypothetical protein
VGEEQPRFGYTRRGFPKPTSAPLQRCQRGCQGDPVLDDAPPDRGGTFGGL